MAKEESSKLYHYAVTAHEPTAVTLSTQACFTAPNHTNLIAVRTRYLDIYKFENEELEKVHKITLNGIVKEIGVFQMPECKTESIVILTRERQLCVLTYDVEKRDVVCNLSLDIVERGKQDVDQLRLVVFKGRPIFGLHVFGGIFHKVTFNNGKWDMKRFVVQEYDVEDICFHANSGGSNLELAILHPDARNQKHVAVYELLEDAGTLRRLWSSSVPHAGAKRLSNLLHLPGLLVFSHEGVTYVHKNQSMRMNDPVQHMYFAHMRIAPGRFIYANSLGILGCVLVNHDSQSVLSLEYVRLGRVSPPSCMTALGPNSVVYIASHWGDSQLIHIQDTKQDLPQGGLIRVLDEYESIAPIQDMAIVDLDRQGQCQVVTCSGVAQTGAICVLREGMGVDEYARIAIPGVRGMWTLKKNYDNKFEEYLVLSLDQQTRVFAANEQGLNEQEKCPGLLMDRESLHLANIGAEFLVQVVDAQIRLLRASDFSLLQNITAPVKITKAANSPTQLVISTGEGRLTYYELSENKLIERHSTQLPNEISCLCMNPLKKKSPRAELIAVGLWKENSVRVLNVQGLKECLCKKIDAKVLPRSVALSSLGSEEVPYLAVGMADGKLHHFMLGDDYSLKEPKRIKLGTKPVNITTMIIENQPYLIALCDSPTMISRLKGRTNYLNLKLDGVSVVRGFNSSDFGDCLALYADGELIIGCGDQVQKLQIRKIQTEKFWPRRIAYFPGYPPENIIDGYVVAGDTAYFGTKVHQFQLKFFDQDIEEVYSVQLKHGYAVEAIRIFPCVNAPPVVIVATAEMKFDQVEPQKGYLTIYSFTESKQLEKLSEVETKGGPMCISKFQNDYLVAGVSSNLHLYEFTSDYSLKLLHKITCNVQTVNVEVSGNVILAADYMYSVTAFCVDPTTNKLQKLARDYERAYCNVIQCLDDNTYINVAGEGNIVVHKRNADGKDLKQRSVLDVVGRYNSGLLMMNSLKAGTLVMLLDEDVEMDGYADELRFRPDSTFLGGTVGGALFCLMTFQNDHFDFLKQLQDQILLRRQPVANLNWEKFRSNVSRGTISKPLRFIDGDVVERWEDFSREEQDEIATSMETTRARISGTLEELLRLH